MKMWNEKYHTDDNHLDCSLHLLAAVFVINKSDFQFARNHHSPRCPTPPKLGRTRWAPPGTWWRWHSRNSESTSSSLNAGRPHPPSWSPKFNQTLRKPTNIYLQLIKSPHSPVVSALLTLSKVFVWLGALKLLNSICIYGLKVKLWEHKISLPQITCQFQKEETFKCFQIP